MCKHHLKITIKMYEYDSECLSSKTSSYLKTIYTSKTGYQMTVVHTQLVSPNENREGSGIFLAEKRVVSKMLLNARAPDHWGKEQLEHTSFIYNEGFLKASM